MPSLPASLSPRSFCAPGRVNLIGDHTDYNGGFALPAAINMTTTVTMSPRADHCVSVHTGKFSGSVDFEIGALEPTPRSDWSDYICGVAWVLESIGVSLRGSNLYIRSDIPVGAGLSSSAALEVAVALALLTRSGIEMERREMALLCQRAENEFVGVRCGIMDQLAACMGRSGHALLLDCRSLDIDYLLIPSQGRLAVCNSMVKHSLASSEYNRRRQDCENAVAILSRVLPNVRQLRDVSLSDLERFRSALDPATYRRCRHVISENQRTLDAADALRNRDLAGFGILMNHSHQSLRDDYEVSCAELDILVELAREQDGVYGSRMTGGGFGGCTISLVEETAVDNFKAKLSNGYALRTGMQCEIYICEAAAGAREVERIQ